MGVELLEIFGGELVFGIFGFLFLFLLFGFIFFFEGGVLLLLPLLFLGGQFLLQLPQLLFGQSHPFPLRQGFGFLLVLLLFLLL